MSTATVRLSGASIRAYARGEDLRGASGVIPGEGRTRASGREPEVEIDHELSHLRPAKLHAAKPGRAAPVEEPRRIADARAMRPLELLLAGRDQLTKRIVVRHTVRADLPHALRPRFDEAALRMRNAVALLGDELP